jgi:5-bromo-4-chloroindolyl phosphate hydrolysis protein
MINLISFLIGMFTPVILVFIVFLILCITGIILAYIERVVVVKQMSKTKVGDKLRKTLNKQDLTVEEYQIIENFIDEYVNGGVE